MNHQPNRSKEVDAYIAAQPTATKGKLEELRDAIWEAAPDLAELMNYNIPAFALVEGGKRDQQIMIAGFAKHVGFYPQPDTIEAFEDRLKDYKFAKGSVQFPVNQPIPRDLVIDMVKYKYSQIRDRS